MPQLDVSFMTSDPMLSDVFDVRRRLNIVRQNGRVDAVPDQLFVGMQGVVTQQDPSELMKTEDGQEMPRRIFIASTFQFIATAPGYQADEITWNGIVYTVTSVLPYSRFGNGTYECIAQFKGPIPAQQ